MQKNIFYMLLLLMTLISCKQEYNFYDVDGPALDFYTFIGDDILFQFNEPVSSIKYVLKKNNQQKELHLNNIFPVANVQIASNFFNKKQKGILQIEAIDTSDNKSLIKMPAPIINIHPAILQIEEVRLKYSKNKKQKIVLKAITSGNTAGYHLILFIRNKKTKVPFLFEHVTKGEKLEICIENLKEKKESNYEIGFSKKNINLYFKYRLSQTASLFFILNNKDHVLDYFMYYNSKKHPFEYYEGKKYFNKLKNELIVYNIQPILFDIAGTTTKKTICKVREKFIIKKY